MADDNISDVVIRKGEGCILSANQEMHDKLLDLVKQSNL